MSTRAEPAGAQKARLLRGEPYLFTDPEILADHHRCQVLLDRFNRSVAADPRAQRELLDDLLGHLGPDAVVRPPLRCDLGYQISIGARSFLNYGVTILDCGRVVIGDDVAIGPNAQLLAAAHPLDLAGRRSLVDGAPVAIGDGAWIGAGAIVCPGVTVGAGTVVAAGSVVVRDLPAGVLAGGNPARIVKRAL